MLIIALYFFYTNSTLDVYCDVVWAVNAEDIKRTLGGYLFLGNDLFCGSIRRSVSLCLLLRLNIFNGECICTELLWMKQMTIKYDVSHDVVTLYCDNISAVNISKNHF